MATKSVQAATLKAIIQQGMTLLNQKCFHTQAVVVCKLETLGYKVSKSAFNNIIKGKNAGLPSLDKTSKGVQEIIASELGMKWSEDKYIRTLNENFQSKEIPCHKSETSKDGFKFHEDGRLKLSEKVAFFKDAQNEVIEFGLTLNTFTSYFFSRNDNEFKNHITTFLENGVNFKCYLLDPDCNEGRLYFDDRRKVQKEEVYPSQKIKSVIEKLRIVQSEFAEADYPGHFEVYTYRHIPYNYFMVVDGKKMMVSHYLYAQPRAKAPVIEFTKKDNSTLFRRYHESLNALIKGAEKVIP